ncbi:hypothetical protein BOTBODRAFT_33114 [Botryobasidium botryosum FD-172 SS1]|uniref:Uncharacterized protein n=1 Tax=Botryobasidium botryosum (strain FD-172 SS1) TaxID=930990 RepID=A0A067MEN1_BOTB1|nr:hypothetical protein BOTBODRAFT_33114 [Botryobasidium botryosum FD-172 SS1]
MRRTLLHVPSARKPLVGSLLLLSTDAGSLILCLSVKLSVRPGSPISSLQTQLNLNHPRPKSAHNTVDTPEFPGA